MTKLRLKMRVQGESSFSRRKLVIAGWIAMYSYYQLYGQRQECKVRYGSVVITLPCRGITTTLCIMIWFLQLLDFLCFLGADLPMLSLLHHCFLSISGMFLKRRLKKKKSTRGGNETNAGVCQRVHKYTRLAIIRVPANTL